MSDFFRVPSAQARQPASLDTPARRPLWPILLFVFSVITAITAWQGLRPTFSQGWMTLGYGIAQALLSTLIIRAMDRANWSPVKSLVTFAVLSLCLLLGMQRHHKVPSTYDAKAEQAAVTRIQELLAQAEDRARQHAEPSAPRAEDQLINRVIELHFSQRRTFQPAYDRLAIEALSTPRLLATETGRHQLDEQLTQAIALVRQHLQQADSQIMLGVQAVQDEALPPHVRERLTLRMDPLRIQCQPMVQRRWTLLLQSLERRQEWLKLLTQAHDRWRPEGELFVMQRPDEEARLRMLADQMLRQEGESRALDQEIRHTARQMLTAL